jgi:hypothetical protein
MTTEAERRAALEALDGAVDRAGNADDALREALEVLGRLYPWAAIHFVEGGELVPGPRAGVPAGEEGRAVDIVFQGMKVGELTAAGDEDDVAFLQRVAGLMAPYCLVGWDTGGETWEP